MLIYPKWSKLPLPTRQGLAALFGVARTRSTHVVDNQVADDGYRIEDLDNAFSTERVQEYVGSKEKDVLVLWDLMVSKFETPEVIEVIAPVEPAPTPEPGTVEETMAKPEKIKVIPAEKKVKAKK